jgi:hypothetical protein
MKGLLVTLVAALLFAELSSARPVIDEEIATVHRHLIFGVNDYSLLSPIAQQLAAQLNLNRYAVPVEWEPGTTLTRRELGMIPADQPVLVILSGRLGARPPTGEQRNAYADFARALVKAYQNIREVQVWNEPTGFWPEYLSLLARTYDRLRGTRVRVLAPGSHPGLGFQKEFVRRVRHYYRATHRRRPLFDAYSVHPYWGWTWTSRVARQMNRQWRGLPQRAPDRGLRFWWTEIGMDSDAGGFPAPAYSGYTGQEPLWRLSGTLEEQAARVGEVVAFAECEPLVVAVFNFLLFDERDLRQWQSGLLDPLGRPKPAYYVFQAAIRDARRNTNEGHSRECSLRRGR